jgi:hypothetical protein
VLSPLKFSQPSKPRRGFGVVHPRRQPARRQAAARVAVAACCDCPAHRAQLQPVTGRASWWSAVLPIAACALCPACVAAWAPLLAAAGIGFALTESHHTALLLVTISLSLGVAVWRARRTQAWVPAILTVFGGASMLAGHALDENALLAGIGVAGFLSAAIVGNLPSRSASAAHAPSMASTEVET